MATKEEIRDMLNEMKTSLTPTGRKRKTKTEEEQQVVNERMERLRAIAKEKRDAKKEIPKPEELQKKIITVKPTKELKIPLTTKEKEEVKETKVKETKDEPTKDEPKAKAKGIWDDDDDDDIIDEPIPPVPKKTKLDRLIELQEQTNNRLTEISSLKQKKLLEKEASKKEDESKKEEMSKKQEASKKQEETPKEEKKPINHHGVENFGRYFKRQR